MRAWCWAGRRLGRRGAILASFGVAFVLAAPPRLETPQWPYAVMFLVFGATAVGAALAPWMSAKAVGFGALMGVACVWTVATVLPLFASGQWWGGARLVAQIVSLVLVPLAVTGGWSEPVHGGDSGDGHGDE